ncbi:DUF4442 domain-containing protein [Pseudomonas sp. ZM23]|uniref:DUF4442 domain-containing protein n=1 Tax=Pseudomonas triclosanedens TaxID=2961893 RepID=A0ABY6ZRV2_9PSED|nr:DUF4442 domain-containing protein [Pseudomonas triclosanedens]MCP8465857.1 DUF4442 domain-containing protein [Pseudomonas triclosanedens]MCP8472178.1 DUF4442 domain-containing protein [Pseudomonas triclosanedens]MCP8477156.1 DUF4442 domain-containing protein [Pseudomonas triclosanedens]WAI47506.1 DUF4442 domain-containing protein [Pseudomonas triclosanedens]
MPKHNRLSLAAHLIQRLPRRLHEPLLSRLFCSQVRFAGTANVRIQKLSIDEVRMSLANQRRVRNHIGGVHAAAMALLAESASGCMVGMNLPDHKLPLIKTLKVDYRRRANGGLRAIATLTQEQRRAMLEQEKGEALIEVTMLDDTGSEPIRCEMHWAWVSKHQ